MQLLLAVLSCLALSAYAGPRAFYPSFTSTVTSGVDSQGHFTPDTDFNVTLSNFQLTSYDGKSYLMSRFKSIDYGLHWNVFLRSVSGTTEITNFVVNGNATQFSIPANTISFTSLDQILHVMVRTNLNVTLRNNTKVWDPVYLLKQFNLAGVSKSFVYEQVGGTNSPCFAQPVNGIAYDTLIGFFCVPVYSQNLTMGINIRNSATNELKQIVSAYTSPYYSSLLPEGTWQTNFTLYNADGSMNASYQGSTVTMTENTAVTGDCLLDTLQAISENNVRLDLTTQAVFAINMLADYVLNDGSLSSLAQSCGITDIPSWRTNSRALWTEMLQNISDAYGDAIDPKSMFKVLQILTNPATSKKDSFTATASGLIPDLLLKSTIALQSVVDTLQTKSLRNGNLNSDSNDAIATGLETAGNIWNSDVNNDCSDSSIDAQQQVVEQLLRLSLKVSSNAGKSSYVVDGVSSSSQLFGSASADVSIPQQLHVMVPPSAKYKCGNTTAAVQIVGSTFRSSCRHNKVALSQQTPSNSYVVKLVNATGGQECQVDDLQENIQIELLITTNEDTEYTCAWYDNEAQAWTSAGCNTTVTGNKVVCSCNHLTEFSALLQARKKLPVHKSTSFELNVFLASSFLICFVVAAHQLRRIVKYVAKETQAVIVPVHVLILLIGLIRGASFALDSSERWLNLLPDRALIFWLSATLVVPVLLFFAMAGLCILSWIAVYHVNVKNQYSEFDVARWRKIFWTVVLFMSVIACGAMGVAIYVPTYEEALRIYRGVMYFFGGIALTSATLFGVYGGLIYHEVASLHRKMMKSNHRKSLESGARSGQLAAALRTRAAGSTFCFSWAVAAACWLGYASMVESFSPLNPWYYVVSLVMHGFEISMMISCMWLYKNAIPKQTIASKSSDNRRRGSDAPPSVSRRNTVSRPRAPSNNNDSLSPDATLGTTELIQIPGMTVATAGVSAAPLSLASPAVSALASPSNPADDSAAIQSPVPQIRVADDLDNSFSIGIMKRLTPDGARTPYSKLDDQGNKENKFELDANAAHDENADSEQHDVNFADFASAEAELGNAQPVPVADVRESSNSFSLGIFKRMSASGAFKQSDLTN